MGSRPRKNAPLSSARQGVSPILVAIVLVVLGASMAFAVERFVPVNGAAATASPSDTAGDETLPSDDPPPDASDRPGRRRLRRTDPVREPGRSPAPGGTADERERNGVDRAERARVGDAGCGSEQPRARARRSRRSATRPTTSRSRTRTTRPARSTCRCSGSGSPASIRRSSSRSSSTHGCRRMRPA